MASPRRRPLLKRICVGGGALAGCVSFGDRDESTRTDRGRPFSYSTGGVQCLPDPNSVESGWVHTVANGDYDVTFDVLLAHGRSSEATASLLAPGENNFDLRFEVFEPATEGQKTPTEADCTFGTRIRGDGTVPSDFRSMRVVAGGEIALTVERDGTFPELHRVPSPTRV